MNVKEVIDYFESQKPERKVARIFQPSKDYVIIEAPPKNNFFGIQSAPNSYLMANKKQIECINPIEDLDRYEQLTNPKFLVYDILKGND